MKIRRHEIILALAWAASNVLVVLVTLSVTALTDSLTAEYPTIGVSKLFPFTFAGIALLACNLTWLGFVIHDDAHAFNATTGISLEREE